jgi:hypothetical protein
MIDTMLAAIRAVGARRHIRNVGIASVVIVIAVVVAVIMVNGGHSASPVDRGAKQTTQSEGSTSSHGETPLNQDSLTRAVEDAMAIAGSDYYADGAIDTSRDTAEIYLVEGTPQEVIDRIKAKHPDVYVFHTAAHTKAELSKLSDRVAAAASSLKAQGVNIQTISTTSDGYLEVGVSANIDLAETKLTEMFGSGWIEVTKSQGPDAPSEHDG